MSSQADLEFTVSTEQRAYETPHELAEGESLRIGNSKECDVILESSHAADFFIRLHEGQVEAKAADSAKTVKNGHGSLSWQTWSPLTSGATIKPAAKVTVRIDYSITDLPAETTPTESSEPNKIVKPEPTISEKLLGAIRSTVEALVAQRMGDAEKKTDFWKAVGIGVPLALFAFGVLGFVIFSMASRWGARSTTEIAKRGAQSAVQVLGRAIFKDRQGNVLQEWRWSGSGVIVDQQQRLIVTNEHVVYPGESDIAKLRRQHDLADPIVELQVVFPKYDSTGKLLMKVEDYADAEKIAANVLTKRKQSDLAVIQVDEIPTIAKEMNLAPETAPVGTRIHVVANPGVSNREGGMWLYRTGTVQGSYKNQGDEGFDADIIQVSAPVMHGDSGGPVFDDNAALVGIVSRGLAEKAGAHEVKREIRLCIDISEVRDILKQARGNLP